MVPADVKANDTAYRPSAVAPAVSAVVALAFPRAGTESVPEAGVTVRPACGVAFHFTVFFWLARLVTVTVAVVDIPGWRITSVGLAETKVSCWPVASEGGASVAAVPHDVLGVVPRSKTRFVPLRNCDPVRNVLVCGVALRVRLWT